MSRYSVLVGSVNRANGSANSSGKFRVFNGGVKGVVLGLGANEPASQGGRPSRDPVDRRPRSSHRETISFFFPFLSCYHTFPLTRSATNQPPLPLTPLAEGWLQVFVEQQLSGKLLSLNV